MKSIAFLNSKAIFIVALSFFCVFVLSQDVSSKLTGNWLCSTEYGSVSLSFTGNSTLRYEGEQYSYNLNNNNLMILVGGQYVAYPFWFDQGNLYVVFPEGYTLIFNKINNEVKKAPEQNQSSQGYSDNSGRYLNGKLCEYGSSSSYSTYSSYSHLNWIYFDGQGNFQFGGEQSYSGSSGSYYDQGGNVQTGTYQITGNQVTVRFSSGEVYTLKVNMVQNDGRITELMYGQKLYASGLCE